MTYEGEIPKSLIFMHHNPLILNVPVINEKLLKSVIFFARAKKLPLFTSSDVCVIVSLSDETILCISLGRKSKSSPIYACNPPSNKRILAKINLSIDNTAILIN